MFGSASGYDFATTFASFGAEVDEMVGLSENIEIVFDDDDSVATRDEALEYVHEDFDVFEMETCGWLVENI